MRNIGIKISNIIEKPARVFGLCICLLLFSLIFDNTALRLYRLNVDQKLLNFKFKEESEKIAKIKQQLVQLKNPAYIEKQALDRLEFLEKGDLLFVFSED